MKKIMLLLMIIVAIFYSSDVSARGHIFRTSEEENNKLKSPGRAAMRNLYPFPIAVGHFYVEEWEKGIYFTLGEIALATAIIIPVINNEDKKWSEWDESEKNIVVGATIGYLAVKIWSAFDAGYAAEEYNKKIKNSSVSLKLNRKQVSILLNSCF